MRRLFDNALASYVALWPEALRSLCFLFARAALPRVHSNWDAYPCPRVTTWTIIRKNFNDRLEKFSL